MNRRAFTQTILGSLALGGEQTGRGRRPVVPKQVIDGYGLRPTEGYGLWVMGEDGLPYSLDDVLVVLFAIVREHWGGEQKPLPMQMRKVRPR